MCGIAALLIGLPIPNLPKWPVWAGSSPKRLPTPTAPVTNVAPLLPDLQRRGPDATDINTIELTPTATLQMVATTLSMRGTSALSDFAQAKTNDDDILLFNGEIYNTPDETENQNLPDTNYLLHLLSTAQDDINVSCLDRLLGPWTFIFWHSVRRRLYFGRDALGRRSLLIRADPGRSLTITSIAPRHDSAGFVELPPAGLAYLDLIDPAQPSFHIIPRESRAVIPTRVLSNGHTLTEHKLIDNIEHRVIAGSGLEMYISFLPQKWLRSYRPLPSPHHPISQNQSAELFLVLFQKSIQRRLVTNRSFTEEEPRFAVLFSGGIDSLVIAATLDLYLSPGEPLHLLNVAFGADSDAIGRCPDRKNAISGLHELRALSTSKRSINLICVDVTPETADETLEKHVRHLLYPCDQPMDASIGTAIWTAARGEGYVWIPQEHSTSRHTTQISTSERVLFSGLGADELMGGYKGRHRTIFRTEGVEGIAREMDADLSRLWFRNLGRDDRLVADHGKELRHPFLDEELISYVTSLPLTEHVCDLSKPDGVGDKHLLRRAARLLGFSEEASSRAKRAIQFGSRSKQVIERKRPS